MKRILITLLFVSILVAPGGTLSLTATAAPQNPPAAAQPGQRPPAGSTNLLLGIMRMTIFLWVGVVLAALPWQDRWTQNTLLLSHPAMREFLASYFTRGAISGLGIVDLWIAASEIARLRRR